MLGCSGSAQFFRVVLPAALPSIFTGMRLGLGFAWVVIVVGEMTGVQTGLGAIIMEARQLSRTEIVHAAQREADQILDAARDRAARKRAEAEDYIDQKLAAFEILLNKTLATVAKGREHLRGETSTAPPQQRPDAETLPQGPFDAEELGEPVI